MLSAFERLCKHKGNANATISKSCEKEGKSKCNSVVVVVFKVSEFVYLFGWGDR